MSRQLTDRRRKFNLRVLLGSGETIMLFTLPFLVVGLVLNIAFPSVFNVGGPPTALLVFSAVVMATGLVVWGWSASLIVRKVPSGQLVVSGPFAWVKHPLYTGVSLLVIPWLGILLNTWLGVAIGIVMYVGSRIFAPREEVALSTTFGAEWDEYRKAVKIPWL